MKHSISIQCERWKERKQSSLLCSFSHFMFIIKIEWLLFIINSNNNKTQWKLSFGVKCMQNTWKSVQKWVFKFVKCVVRIIIKHVDAIMSKCHIRHRVRLLIEHESINICFSLISSNWLSLIATVTWWVIRLARITHRWLIDSLELYDLHVCKWCVIYYFKINLGTQTNSFNFMISFVVRLRRFP